MPTHWPHRTALVFCALLTMLLGAFAIVRLDIAQRREAFQADARIAHRQLSQRAAQHDAILDTLGLLGPAMQGDAPERRLPAVYAQVVSVMRREADGNWPRASTDTAGQPSLQLSETRSRAERHATLARVNATSRHYTLVRAGEPAFALEIDVQRMVPWDEWPIQKDGPVGVVLRYEGRVIVIQEGQDPSQQPTGLTDGFFFAQPLASASQPFELQLRRATGPAQWPWRWLLGWSLLCAGAAAGVGAWLQARRSRQRAEELLRIGRVARLNALGELAAGMAHELNQPLTAVAANTQAARRLLEDDPPALDAARQAMVQATAQARRAADVVGRLRRLVASPETHAATRAIALEQVARQVLDLMAPEARRIGARLLMEGASPPVQADPVALEQVLHNLVGNALQALERSPTADGLVRVAISAVAGHGVLCVQDNGPGIAPAELPHVFEPFHTTREDGLGLGLSLCETLAQAMDGTIGVRALEPRGTEFRLALPLAKPDATTAL